MNQPVIAPPLDTYELQDRYRRETGRVFLTGTQALVRLPMLQRALDRRRGLNTAGFISGYRGSPLGAYDQELWRAERFLRDCDIQFLPAINEDLAATAILGTQQVETDPAREVDGVFSIWYGKGPGVDRSGDALKHGNAYGSSPHGGVLVIAGDDHGCVSSSMSHQSDVAFMAYFMPTLNPASVAEYIEYGLYGFALSRYSGTWVGFKAISETVESAASVALDYSREFNTPEDYQAPDYGLHYRWPDLPGPQVEARMVAKLEAVRAFARANPIDRAIYNIPDARFGIITTGKGHLDLMEALRLLGIDEARARELGIDIYKVGMVWPLETRGARAFLRGKDEVLVVEEKRGIIESELKEALYDYQSDKPSRMVGKYDEEGRPLVPWTGELSPALLAPIVAARITHEYPEVRFDEQLAALRARQVVISVPTDVKRTPYFCAGCPHNTSTRVPEGSKALAGIGCHFMASWMDRNTESLIQMGGEGVNWVGKSRFTGDGHVFQNLGEGTYFHSGYMAIRQAVAAGTNITYKILFNDAVALTGGQPMDGGLTVPAIAHQLVGEGAAKIVVVAEEPEKYGSGAMLPSGTEIHHRDDLDAVQRTLRTVAGVSVLIYDQTCAAEKRRRRKRNAYPDPPKRAFINKAVCEGCGDCSAKSNCLSVVPVETTLGRKREIDQSACNKDFSCIKGFCPSFVTVHGGGLRKPQPAGNGNSADFDAIPEPHRADCTERPYNILVTGVGGTGVLTIGNVLGMAAHLEGKGCTVLDMSGLAQKFGPVMSHVRIGRDPSAMSAISIAVGSSDLLLGCDIVVGAGKAAVTRLSPGRSRAVVNTHPSITGDFTRNPDLTFPADDLRRVLETAVGPDAATFIDSTRIATALTGDAIAANLFLLGIAYQKGLVPVSGAAIDRAIELNGVAIDMNQSAFRWGRLAVHDPALIEQAAPAPAAATEPRLDEIVRDRIEDLKAYQDDAYARRYKDLVVRVQKAESVVAPQSETLSTAVARAYHKLLAYKDEYEVARLYTDGRFDRDLRRQFDGDYKLRFHLAPPLLTRIDPETGERNKRAFGPWILPVFRLLASMKGLRGSRWDVFGYQAERRMERQLIADYDALIEKLLDGLTRENLPVATELAGLPLKQRGFGHIKERAVSETEAEKKRLLARFEAPSSQTIASAAE
ncbi:MAG: indolepyruvate ferredoxin oxidoreductase family protein [Alphaproteobacteria bacterium]